MHHDESFLEGFDLPHGYIAAFLLKGATSHANLEYVRLADLGLHTLKYLTAVNFDTGIHDDHLPGRSHKSPVQKRRHTRRSWPSGMS